MARGSVRPLVLPPAAPTPCGGSSACRTSVSSRPGSFGEVEPKASLATPTTKAVPALPGRPANAPSWMQAHLFHH